jgi:hypothetical protein
MASATNPSDYLTLVTNQIIVLLTAQPFFKVTVPIGNRYSYLTGVQWPIPPNTNAGTQPRVILSCPDGRTIQRNSEKTFSNARSAIGDVIVVKECVFLLTFLYNTADRYLANQMDYAVDGALLADPKIGLANPVIRTSGEGMTRRVTEESNDETGGTKRVIQRIRFPVVVELHRVDLVAAGAYGG